MRALRQPSRRKGAGRGPQESEAGSEIRLASVTFLGALAGANTAAKFLSMDDEGAAKIVIETSGDQAANVLKLVTMGKKLLRIVVSDEIDNAIEQ